MTLAVLIVAALALALAAFALWVALGARSRAIDAQQRTARHQSEHRVGLEDTGLRRHRAVEEPATEQLAAQPRPRPAAPETALAAATPPESGPYARLRASRDDTVDLSEHATPRRPGSSPNFRDPAPRTAPALPPPGSIDRPR